MIQTYEDAFNALKIDTSNLNNELANYAVQFVEIAQLEAQAKAAAVQAKFAYEQARERAILTLRADKTKTMTVAQVEAAANTSSTVTVLESAMQMADANHRRFAAVLNGFERRHTMLEQLSARETQSRRHAR